MARRLRRSAIGGSRRRNLCNHIHAMEPEADRGSYCHVERSGDLDQIRSGAGGRKVRGALLQICRNCFEAYERPIDRGEDPRQILDVLGRRHGSIGHVDGPDPLGRCGRSDGNAISVLGKRPGKFDSSFPEVGPPPVITRNGIVVIYNGKNDPEHGDPELGPNAYAAGQALFAADDPARLISRAEKPFFKPEMPFEKTGQYAAGTTFVEGLVFFQKRWFMYYGCADSLVGVAVSR